MFDNYGCQVVQAQKSHFFSLKYWSNDPKQTLPHVSTNTIRFRISTILFFNSLRHGKVYQLLLVDKLSRILKWRHFKIAFVFQKQSCSKSLMNRQLLKGVKPALICSWNNNYSSTSTNKNHATPNWPVLYTILKLSPGQYIPVGDAEPIPINKYI